MQAHVALAADGHAEGTVTEHLDADLFPAWAANVLCLYFTIDLGYLVHIQLACQYYDIGKLGIELQGLDVRDVQLGGEMHLLSHLPAILHHSDIAGDNCRYAGLLGGIDNLMHQWDILTVNDGIHGEITLDAVFLAFTGDVAQVVDGEHGGGVGPHVQLLDAEVNTIGTGLYRCR